MSPPKFINEYQLPEINDVSGKSRYEHPRPNLLNDVKIDEFEMGDENMDQAMVNDEMGMPNMNVPYLVSSESMQNQKPVTPKITNTKVNRA